MEHRNEELQNGRTVTGSKGGNAARIFTNIGDEKRRRRRAALGDIGGPSSMMLNKIRTWNNEAPPAVHACLHDQVREQSRLRPDAAAVCAWDGKFTYSELEVQAKQVAHHLVTLGVGPEVMVGMCMEKSKWAVVAMLAILEAGGAVVPLGVQHPIARIKGIMRETAATVILVDAEQAQRLAGQAPHIVTVDAALLDRVQSPSGRACESVKPENVAWVIFTSGSTGMPKGVVLEHMALCTSIQAHGEAFGMDHHTRTLQFSAYTFDISIQDIFTTLHNGGCICIPSQDELLQDVGASIRRMAVTLAALTSTIASLLKPVDAPTLQTLVLVGEAVKPSVVENWGAYVNVINSYGPAECSIAASYNSHVTEANRAAVIGHPLAVCLWVVDELDHNRLCPIGAPGELLIEGPQLARGYLNDGEKTAMAFVTDPGFVQQYGFGCGRRMYRTGDLVRQNDDGSLTFLGRRDTQIKIRGQRVETGEIEYWITRLGQGIRTAAVDLLHRGHNDEQAQLVAVVDFVDSDTGSATGAAEDTRLLEPTAKLQAIFSQLYESISQVLPPYMVPSLYIPINKLPHNTSSKLDRRALQAFIKDLDGEQLRLYLTTELKEPPTTVMEQQLQTLWAAVFGSSLDAVGRHDHFFQTGGDSVMAMRLVAAAGEKKLSLTVADIFKYPRLSVLAQEIDRKVSKMEDEVRPFELWIDEQVEQRKAQLETVATQCGVTVEQIEDMYPCTPFQEETFAATGQRKGAYIMQQPFRLTETINIARLQKAWEKLAQLLAILRTRIVILPRSGLMQVVTRESITWSKGESLEAYLAEDRAIGIGYGKPLVRFAIIIEQRPGGKIERHFIWTAHHSVYDGYSMGKMFDLLARLYHNEDVPSPVPFTRFLRYLSQVDKEKEREFWCSQLEGMKATIFPPRLHSIVGPRTMRSVVQQMTGCQYRGPETVSTILRAAWALVVAQQTGVDEALLSITLSGRAAPVPQIMEVLAPTITTVPVRIRIDRTQSVGDFLTAVQRQAIDMMPFEHTGLHNIRRLVPDLESGLDAGHLFVVQAMDDRESMPYTARIGLEEQKVSLEDFQRDALSVICTTGAADGSIEVEAHFDTRIIGEVTVQMLLSQFQHIFYQVCTKEKRQRHAALGDIGDPCTKILEQIRTWNQDIPPAVHACLHDQVREQSLLRPDAVAVCAWDGELTYGELEAQAEQVAHYLVMLGVGPEVMVGVCMDKSKWAVVAILSILKAGGAVVPLGRQDPVTRIEAIMRETAATVILVDASQAQRLAGQAPHIVTVDAALLDRFQSPLGRACESVKPENVAWVIFTSGSTGTPKGVVLEHIALCTSIQVHGPAYGIDQHTRTLQFSAYTWDVSISDILATLQFGGCVCVPSEEDRINNLSALFHRFAVTFADLTPTVIRMLNPSDCLQLKILAVGGEALDTTMIERWSPHVRLIIGYGPAECSIVSSFNSHVTSVTQVGNIGHPTAVRLWVVDELNYNRLCPIGVPGELLIEGPQLARGYLNDAEKTAATFVTDPGFVQQYGFSRGRRMYRTGDLVRQNDNGSLTFLGRRDTQIKIRGQRVETGEIEYWITRLGQGIHTAAVNVLHHGHDNNQALLVAAVDFVDSNTGGSTGPVEDIGLLQPSAVLQATFSMLHKSLSQVLLPYMVPSFYIPFNKLPLNPSGKLDRQAILTLMTSLDRQQLASYLTTEPKELPTTATEQQLQTLWAALFGISVDAVARHDHFFQSGGDSVMAMQLVATASDENLPLRVEDIFKYPRLSDLAREIENRGEVKREDEVAPFELWADTAEERTAQLQIVAEQCQVSVNQIEDVYPCTPLQEGMFAMTGHRDGAYVMQQPFRLTETINIARLQKAWEKLAQLQAILRTRIVILPRSGLMQVVTRESITWSKGESLEAYLAEDRAIGIGYGKPLVRFAIIIEQRPGGKIERHFIWTAHHSVYDGYSMGKMFDLLARLYHNEDVPSPVPFTRFLRYLSQVNKEKEREFWCSQLEGIEASIFPPRPRTLAGPRAMRNVGQRIGHCQHGGSETVSIILRAAWALTIAQQTGANEALLAVTMSGRTAPVPQILHMLAPTITTVPVRIRVGAKQSISDFLTAVQQQAAEMMPFEHTGLQNIRRMVPGLENELDAGHLFVVQAVQENETMLAASSIGMEKRMVNLEEFQGHALSVICTTDTAHELIEVNARFDTRVIGEVAVQMLLSQFKHIFNQLSNGDVLQRQMALADIRGPSAEMLNEIRTWNHKVPPAVHACLHDQVREQSILRPDAVAVCAWDGELTYSELEAQAEQVAHYLVMLGVGPEVMVGVCMDKSKWAVVAILSILKAGGAVVPLGRQDPVTRIEAIMRETAATVILVDASQAQRLAGQAPHIVTVDVALLDRFQSPLGRACESVKPENVAWVIFTSGSTGTPKGVVLEHTALCTSFQARGPAFGMDHHTRTLQFSALTFDISISDILATLQFGGCVCLPSEHDRINNLSTLFRTFEVTFANITPTVVRMLDPSDCPQLKTIVAGGEAMDATMIERWSSHLRLIIGYGPAECSITASYNSHVTSVNQVGNIGYPMAVCLWVVDELDHNRLCPIGAPGELLIEGPQLARGYLNDTEKTDAAFVTDPGFVQQYGFGRGRRMYRTGDLVRQNDDGSLTFIGRRDTQVKIRGQRVEIGEIEYWITRLGQGVRSAVVELMHRRHDHEQAQLVAVVDFIDSDTGSGNGPVEDLRLLEPTAALQATFSQLYESLYQVLPSYMVPGMYVPTTRLPLNTSSKLDRRALQMFIRTVDREQIGLYLTIEPKELPLTATERRLQTLWAALFGSSVDSVGRHDHFFQTGGDSIMAMRLVAAADNDNLSLTVADIFKHPRLSDLARQVANHSESNKSDELVPFELWIDDAEERTTQLEAVAEQCGVTVQQIEDVYPCTPLQEGTFATTTQRKGAYIMQRCFQLNETVSVARLQIAWQKLAELLAILRTRIIVLPQSGSMQVVIREPILWTEGESLKAYLTEDRSMEMSYGRPLVRFAIITEQRPRKKIKRHFVWTAHHSVYDGYSIGKMFNLLASFYRGEDVPPPVPFSPFLRYLKGLDKESAREFWCSQLEGMEATVFPPRPHTLSGKCTTGTVVQSMSGRQHGGSETVSTILRAAWALVVAEQTGADEALLAVTLSGRTAPVPQIVHMLAPTITTVPVRIRIDSRQSVHSFLAAVQRQAVDMMPFEHTGLQNIRRLVPGLESGLDAGHLFIVQAADDREMVPAAATIGLEEQTADVEAFQGAALDVICAIGTADGSIEVVASFDMRVIGEVAVQMLLSQFKHIFNQLSNGDVLQRQMALADIRGPSAEMLNEIRTWNHEVPPAVHACLHDQVREQSILRPDAVAVCAWDGELTYGELEAQAEQVAHYLVMLGVGPEVMVGVCMDKSKWAVVAMLSILKAGGAVVPLGVQYPVARIEIIISKTAATVLLVDASQAQRLAGQAPHIVTVDAAMLDRVQSPSGRACESVKPENVAWVIFTSGSTGMPKGVVLEHTALCTSIQAHGEAFGMDHHTRTLQFSAYTFDISIQDIFTTLHNGGCVCVPSEDERLQDVGASIRRMGVTLAALTSTMASFLKPVDVPTLQTLVLVGEAVKPSVVDNWGAYVNVINSYGPAECSIAASYNSHVTEANRAAVIGHPLAVCLWVVDELNHNRLCPIGAPGELLIEGPQLARGYLNDTEKTDAAFVTDPGFVQQYGFGRGRRMYRTGDLVRQNDDGSLTFLGRRDTQVKIRGQRVEIGEIEYWAEQHPAVKDVVVLYPQQGPFQNRLVGIIVLHDFASTTGHTSQIQRVDPAKLAGLSTLIPTLRQHLSRHVMEYMIPTTWVPLAALPLNISSKVDRLQLSQWITSLDPTEIPVIADSSMGDASQTPATALERQLQGIWSRVLNVPLARIALDRSFLALGGDSVTAMEVVSHARSEGLQLTVRNVLHSQAISQLALSVVVTGQPTLYEDDTPYDPFPLSPIQQLYFDSIASAGLDVQDDNRYNHTVLLHLTREVDSAEMSRALEAVTAKHGMLRARFYEHETLGWQQKVAPHLSGSFGFRVHHLLNEETELYNRLAASQRSLNLKHGPVFAADHIQLAGRQLLFLAAHHLVIDLVSWRIILHDLEELLQTRTLSMPRSLSFRTWSQLQSEFSRQQVAVASTIPFEVPQPNWDYWGLVRGTYLSADTVSETVSLNAHMTEALFGLCNKPLRTEPVEILLAALFHSFHRCFPDRSIPAIFNEGNGREPWNGSIDLSDTVGWFTTMTPVHVPEVGEDIVKTLIWTKECRRRTPGQGLPYFTARYMTNEGRALFAQHDWMEILMKYRGQDWLATKEDALFHASSEQVLSPVGPKTRQLAVFDIEVSVLAGVTQIDFNFSRHIRYKSAIQGWIKSLPVVLDELLSRLKRLDPINTSSDLLLVKLTDNDLTVIEQPYLPDMGTKRPPLPFEPSTAFNHPTSLLETVRLKFVPHHDIPHYNTFSSNYIADILPATDYQALSVAGALSQTQVGVKHYVINCDGPQNLSNIRRSCLKLIDELEILRTLYVYHGEHMMQVILRSYDPDIQIYQIQQDIESFTDDLIRRRMDRPLRFGQPLVHFAIVTRQSTLQHRVILRLTHAEYDRTSLFVILETLQSLIRDPYDRNVHNHPGFSSYVYDLYSRKTQETFQYWTSFLRGSSMPQISSIMSPTNQTPLKIRTLPSKIIITKSVLSGGITSAVVVKAAWALVLARYTKTADVVFGDTINGRVSASPSVAEAVGCCATLIPARVVIQNHWKVTDLLYHIRDQQLANMEHDGLGFRDMIHKCTDWPTSLRCTSTVNLIPHGTLLSTTHDDQYSISDVSFEDRTSHADITITSVAHSDHLDISLTFAFESIFEDTAKGLLSHLSKTVEEFLNFPQKSLAHFSMEGLDGLWQLQKKSPKIHGIPKAICEQVQAYDAPESLLSILKNTWTLALQARRGRPTSSNPTFSDLGGDIIDAARVVSLLQQQDLHVSIDDVLECSNPLHLAGLISK